MQIAGAWRARKAKFTHNLRWIDRKGPYENIAVVLYKQKLTNDMTHTYHFIYHESFYI